MVDRVLMDYVLPKRMRGRLLNVNVCRGEGGGMSDHLLVGVGGSSIGSGGWM